MNKRRVSIMVSVMIFIQIISFSFVQAADVNGKYISSQGACVIDYDTGKILYNHNGNTPRVPASITKLMTVYCVYDAIKDGKISFDTRVPISKYVYDLSRNPEYQGTPLFYEEVYTVDEMISLMITYSACAPAVALAELVGGSEANFINIMNNTAKKMGIDAVYYDCFGVAKNMISPVGIAELTRNLIKEFPDIINRTSKKSINFHGKTFKSTNRLFSTNYYEGADGMKTGTTTAAGYCFCATAIKNGRRIIAVTMASESSDKRFYDATVLLNYGFSIPPESLLTPVIYYTDIKTYINGHEIPTLMYKDSSSEYAVIIAENLINYGFDVIYDDNKKLLEVIHSPNKEKTALPLDLYADKNGQKAFDVYKSDIKVAVHTENEEYNIKNVHSINGYMLIPIDEFAEFSSFNWNNNERFAEINTEN